MSIETTPGGLATPELRPVAVYSIAAGCLALGIAVGYWLLVPQATPAGAPVATSATPDASLAQSLASKPVSAMPTSAGAGPAAAAKPNATPPGGANHSTMELGKRADLMAAPLIAKLGADPKNPDLLAQIGAIYHQNQQFKQAATYYSRAVEAAPADGPVRTKLATALFRAGDANGAINQLEEVLKRAPKDANALFDLGFIKLQARNDTKGALEAWKQLLKLNPQLPAERRELVQKHIQSLEANQAENKSNLGAETK